MGCRLQSPPGRLLLPLLLSQLLGVVEAARDGCAVQAHKLWTPPGGVSAGLTACLTEVARYVVESKDPYTLIDAPLTGVERLSVTTGFDGVLPVVQWSANVSRSDLANSTPAWRRYQYSFNRAEWLLPPGYAQKEGEARVVFVHGGNAGDSAVGPYYGGLTTRLANWTGLPVLAFDYPDEPLVPWPQNLRHVLRYVGHALHHGPHAAGMAGRVFVVADSEGGLVATQALIALRDAPLRTLLGYGYLFPADTADWLGGVVLSSPVLDVSCRTPSFATNCYNYSDPRAPTPAGIGDPDTGNCRRTPLLADRVDDCLWSYLEYFYGFDGVLDGAPRPRGAATHEHARRAEFFAQPTLSPLQYNLSGFPPLLLLSGARDFFYSDGPALHERACRHGVDVTSFNVRGAFHDFIEYSAGCGGNDAMPEAVEAYARVRAFVRERMASRGAAPKRTGLTPHASPRAN